MKKFTDFEFNESMNNKKVEEAFYKASDMTEEDRLNIGGYNIELLELGKIDFFEKLKPFLPKLHKLLLSGSELAIVKIFEDHGYYEDTKYYFSVIVDDILIEMGLVNNHEIVNKKSWPEMVGKSMLDNLKDLPEVLHVLDLHFLGINAFGELTIISPRGGSGTIDYIAENNPDIAQRYLPYRVSNEMRWICKTDCEDAIIKDISKAGGKFYYVPLGSYKNMVEIDNLAEVLDTYFVNKLMGTCPQVKGLDYMASDEGETWLEKGKMGDQIIPGYPLPTEF